MQDNQRTLRKEYIFEGKGLHSGKKVKMTLSPAPTGSGIIFLREDLGPDAVMEAVADYVTTTQRGTTMEKGEIRVSTAEHLLSAFPGQTEGDMYMWIVRKWDEYKKQDASMPAAEAVKRAGKERGNDFLHLLGRYAKYYLSKLSRS